MDALLIAAEHAALELDVSRTGRAVCSTVCLTKVSNGLVDDLPHPDEDLQGSVPLVMATPIRVNVVYDVGSGPALLPVPHLARLPCLLLDSKGTNGKTCHVLATVDLELTLLLDGRCRRGWNNQRPILHPSFQFRRRSRQLLPGANISITSIATCVRPDSAAPFRPIP